MRGFAAELGPDVEPTCSESHDALSKRVLDTLGLALEHRWP